MKKIVTLFSLLALATCVQAATIKWTISGSTTYVVNDYSGNPYASQTIYLVDGSYLDSLVDVAQSKKDFQDTLEAITIATATSSSTGTKPTNVSNLEVSSNMMTAGSLFSFGIVLISEKDGFGYIKTYSVNGTPYADDAPTANRTGKATTAWAATGIDKGSWTKSYTVPEPSTAALALAGLALLLKRRKA